MNKIAVLRQIVSFGIIGTIGFLIDIGVLYLVKGLFGLYFGRIISFVCAVVGTWILNRIFTFQSKNIALLNEFIIYFGCMLFGGLVNIASYYILILYFDLVQIYPVIGVAVGSLLGMAVNFVTSKFIVFKTKI